MYSASTKVLPERTVCLFESCCCVCLFRCGRCLYGKAQQGGGSVLNIYVKSSSFLLTASCCCVATCFSSSPPLYLFLSLLITSYCRFLSFFWLHVSSSPLLCSLVFFYFTPFFFGLLILFGSSFIFRLIFLLYLLPPSVSCSSLCFSFPQSSPPLLSIISASRLIVTLLFPFIPHLLLPPICLYLSFLFLPLHILSFLFLLPSSTRPSPFQNSSSIIYLPLPSPSFHRRRISSSLIL